MMTWMAQLTERAKADAFTLEDECDLGFLCREIAEVYDEMRKEAKARQELFGRRIAEVQGRAAMRGELEDDDLTVRGELATGVPSIKSIPKIPKTGSEEYLVLCRWFGIPVDLAQSGAVKFSFTHLQAFCEAARATGIDVPPGIVGTYSEPMTTFRRKN